MIPFHSTNVPRIAEGPAQIVGHRFVPVFGRFLSMKCDILVSVEHIQICAGNP